MLSIVCLRVQVLHVWRQWLAERHRKNERLAAAAQFYRDELLRQGVTHVLTYTAHMNAFSTDMALLSHEQVRMSGFIVLVSNNSLPLIAHPIRLDKTLLFLLGWFPLGH